MQKEGDFEINPEIIYPFGDSKTKNEDEKTKTETEEFGVEAKAAVDSRIYKRPSFFSVYLLLSSLEI